MDFHTWWTAFVKAAGLSEAALITGAIGSLISFRFVATLGTFGRTATFFGGVAAASFTSQPLAEMFLAGKYVGGVGFLVGVLGMGVLAVLLIGLKSVDLWGLIKAKIGG